MEKLGFAAIPALIRIDISGSLRIVLPLIGETPPGTVYGVNAGLTTSLRRY
jgi:hypothetical protein